MTDEQDEALGQLRGAAEELKDLSQRLYSRLNDGDIPWNAASEIQGEFGQEHARIGAEIAVAEKALRESLERASKGGV